MTSGGGAMTGGGRRRPWLRLLAVAMAAAALTAAGCVGRAGAPRADRSAGSRPLVLKDGNGSGPSTTLILPGEPRSLDMVPFEVRLAAADLKPRERVAVRIELAMPDMPMPQNVVRLKEAAPGVYRGRGQFTMAGRWKATVVESGNQAASSSTFPITVR